MEHESEVVLITGAARGIGYATARLYAEKGATVWAADINHEDSDRDANGITNRRLDVTSLEAWGALISEIEGRDGRLDSLVNNAGIVGSYDGIVDIGIDVWEHVIATNQTSVFFGMRAVIPLMRKQQRGSIVNVSSIWGLVGSAGVAAYQASKGAVTLMTKNASLTYAADGIRVNSVHPGLITTPLTDAQDQSISDTLVAATALGRPGLPEEVGSAIVFLTGPGASYITGAQLVVDGGFTVA